MMQAIYIFRIKCVITSGTGMFVYLCRHFTMLRSLGFSSLKYSVFSSYINYCYIEYMIFQSFLSTTLEISFCNSGL